MESVSFFEDLSGDWLMAAGLVFVVPKLIFGTIAVLLANAEKVPFLNRLMGDRIQTLKRRLKGNLRNNIRPFSRTGSDPSPLTDQESDAPESLHKK